MPAPKNQSASAYRVAAQMDRLLGRVEDVRAVQRDLLDDVADTPAVQVTKPAPSTAIEKPNKSKKPNLQSDLFAPMLFDVGARDSRCVMDVAPFRLSKSDKRANSVIHYQLPEGYVEVSSGPDGMASVFDYDLVLMGISTLTEAMNRFREGRGPKPSEMLRPQITDIVKFCRKENGGNQRQFIADAVSRLMGTKVSIKRPWEANGKTSMIDESFTLISDAKVISSAKTKKVESIEFALPRWMYLEITTGKKPDVLTVHPDYFSNESGISRFLYRLARKAAGKGSASWSFELVFQRSGSTGTLKEFNRALRKIIAENDVPEYDLAEVNGQAGPILSMINRKSLAHIK